MMTNTMSSTATATHPTPGVLARIAAIGARLGRFPLAIHQLLFRFAIAGVFLRAGLDKVRSWESTVALFRDEYKVPVLPPEFAAAHGVHRRDRVLDAPDRSAWPRGSPRCRCSACS